MGVGLGLGPGLGQGLAFGRGFTRGALDESRQLVLHLAGVHAGAGRVTVAATLPARGRGGGNVGVRS